MKLSLTVGLAVLAVGINAKELKANLIQKASTVTGQQNGKPDPGQVDSDTSDENFINICDGKTLTNGKQIEAGSCNGIPMGDIPSKNNMVSSFIIFPKTGEPVKAGQSFDIKVKVTNIVTGFFTNPLETYYAAPQKLQDGKVVGHTHVTVQDMGNTMNPENPLPPDKFSFFKGINTKADGNGVLSATVTDGLPPGKYRACTLTSAANHQSVIMPVAQRGAQDDCTKFEVTAAGGGDDKDGAAAKKASAENKKNKGGNKDAKARGSEKNKNDDDKDAKASGSDKNENGGGKDAKASGSDKNKNGGGKDAKANGSDKNENGGGKDAKASGSDKNKDDDDKDAKASGSDKNKNGGGNNNKIFDAFKFKANFINNDKEENKAKNDAEKNSREDNNDDKPKAADSKSKKSTRVDMEKAEKRPGVNVEDCQSLDKRTTTENIKNTANLEGENEIKNDSRNKKRFSRVFIS